MPDLADRPVFGLGEAIDDQRRSPRIGIAVAAVVIAAFVAGIWYVYDRGVRRGDLKALPVITAEGGPVKTSPADAGGLKVPHVDGEMPRASAGRGSKVEDILPPPERPLAERKLAERAAPVEPPKPLAALPSDPPKAEAPKAETPGTPPPVATVEVAPRPTPAPPAAIAKVAPSEPVEKAAAVPAPAAAPAQPSPAPTAAAPPSPPPAAGEKAAPTVANVAPAAGRAGAYRIQLASVGDRKAAEGEWRRLTRANGDVLGKLSHSVVTVDLAGKGTFHRLSAGPFADRGAAAEACETLHKRKVGCFVVAP